jgi:hypothetical protein
MELVKEYVDQYEERQSKVHTKETFQTSLRLSNGVQVFIDGVEIGQIQSISFTPERETEPLQELGFTQNEGTITLQNTETSRQLLRELICQETMPTYEVRTQMPPNREERRKKPSQRKGDEQQDPNKKKLKQMLGGRNKWN